MVVISCYLLSLFGILYAVIGMAALFNGGSLLGTIVILVWLFAVSALLKMSHAWICNIRLGAKYSRNAFTSGISALFALPILGALDVLGAGSLEAPKMFAQVALLEVILVFPSIALAAYLNRFHAAHGELPSD